MPRPSTLAAAASAKSYDVVGNVLATKRALLALLPEVVRKDMDDWIQKRFNSVVFHGTERRSKYLTFSEINKVLAPVVHADGTYLDPCGARLALTRASLDRINPRVGYVLDNLRIIDIGLNRIKGNYVDDSAIIAYLKQLASSSLL